MRKTQQGFTNKGHQSNDHLTAEFLVPMLIRKIRILHRIRHLHWDLTTLVWQSL